MSPETAVVRRILARLRRVCPLDGPVAVRLAAGLVRRGLNGEAALTPDGNRRIRVQRGLDADVLCDTLIHEWAHLFAWDLHPSRDIEEHGAEWGHAFAEVYTAYWREAARPRK